MSSDETTRVDFDIPSDLINKLEALAELRDGNRDKLIVDLLRKLLSSVPEDEQLRKMVMKAYYEETIDLTTVQQLLSEDEARRVELLKESIDSLPPVPDIDLEDLPSDEEFYGGPVRQWVPDSGDDSTEDDEFVKA